MRLLALLRDVNEVKLRLVDTPHLFMMYRGEVGLRGREGSSTPFSNRHLE